MRVLHIHLDTVMGGIESFLWNVYRKIDRDKIQFDFIEYGYEERSFDQNFEKLGARIFKLPNRRRAPFKARKILKQIICENHYSVVHIHKNSLSDSSAIKICTQLKIPTIIVHSHNTKRDSKLIVCLHKFNLHFIHLDSCIKFACSEEAGNWLFGECSNSVRIVNNGIELEKFSYHSSIRNHVRERLKIDSFFVIGSVGRISQQKNPMFLVNIFHKLRKFYCNLKLLWVGDGELRNTVENLVQSLGEKHHVIFTGNVENPEYYYEAMDLFVMPSFYEGFPIAAIEAQTSGLPCILSDTISRDVAITESVEYLSLQQENIWIKRIREAIEQKFERIDQTERVREKGYDIKSTVDFLQGFYLKSEQNR